jgi:hypothetical protein
MSVSCFASIETALCVGHLTSGDYLPDASTPVGQDHQQVAPGFGPAEDLVEPLATSTYMPKRRVACLFGFMKRHTVPGLDLVQNVVVDLKGLNAPHLR